MTGKIMLNDKPYFNGGLSNAAIKQGTQFIDMSCSFSNIHSMWGAATVNFYDSGFSVLSNVKNGSNINNFYFREYSESDNKTYMVPSEMLHLEPNSAFQHGTEILVNNSNTDAEYTFSLRTDTYLDPAIVEPSLTPLYVYFLVGCISSFNSPLGDMGTVKYAFSNEYEYRKGKSTQQLLPFMTYGDVYKPTSSPKQILIAANVGDDGYGDQVLSMKFTADDIQSLLGDTTSGALELAWIACTSKDDYPFKKAFEYHAPTN